MRLLLANTAMHPQYAGERLRPLRDNPFSGLESDHKELLNKSLNDMRLLAVEFGCHQAQPSTLFMKHVYASNIRAQISALESLKETKVHDAYQVAKFHSLNPSLGKINWKEPYDKESPLRADC